MLAPSDPTRPLPSHCANVIQAHRGGALVCRFDTLGEYCLTGGQDKLVKLWNPLSGKLIKEYGGHGWEVLDIKVNADHSKFISCGGDRAVFVWDVSTGSTVRRLGGHSGHTHRINAVDWLPDESVVASASYDATVRLWDMRSSARIPIQILSDAKDSCSSVHMQGFEILTASIDGRCRVYDVRRGMLSTDDLGAPVTSARFSIDNATVLACCMDSSLRLVDRGSGVVLNRYTGHLGGRFKLNALFALNDSVIVCGSEDGRALVWDTVSASVLRTLPASASIVSSVDFSPSKPAVLAADTAGNVSVFTPDPA